MDTRLNRYNENNNMSRVAKHEELYKEINNGELDDFSVKSNATVIGNQEQEIDIEKIKKILDKRYNEAPRRRSIRIEPKDEEDLVNEEPTKEYDLNLVLEKAKDEKPETYEENRAKKLRNTQYDILNNLNLESEEEEKALEEVKEEENHQKASQDELMELINTITINETKLDEIKNMATSNEECDPLDILEDLKGSENTQVYEGISEQIKVVEEKEKKEVKEEPVKGDVDNSFYTSNLFKKKDFVDDNRDFVDDEKLGIGVKILIGLVVISFLVGIFLFLKSFLNF